MNSYKTQVVCLSDRVTFLGHVFDMEGCYQPPVEPSTAMIRAHMRQVVQSGTTRAVDTGRTLAAVGKRVATRMITPLKRRGFKGTEKVIESREGLDDRH